jgi:Bacterial regulatory helix-turn-helix protein, lysR family
MPGPAIPTPISGGGVYPTRGARATVASCSLRRSSRSRADPRTARRTVRRRPARRGVPKRRTLELRHLRYFVAVAEELDFRNAAERLHVAQPAVSEQVPKCWFYTDEGNYDLVGNNTPTARRDQA